MASQRNGTLYIGVTSNLVMRVWQHQEGQIEGFTKKYGVKTLGSVDVWCADRVCADFELKLGAKTAA
jgi:predicted GIY-YIG superfamily endonuclease